MSSQGYGFSSSHVWMWELDWEESWVPKNWYFWTVVLEKTLESPLDCKEIQPVHSKGDQPWAFFRRNDAKAETPILWPPHVKSWLIRKDSDAGRELGAGEGDARGWDGWMASLTQWTWVWVNSGSWWWTGSPGVLWFMGSQRVGHDRATERNWTESLLKTLNGSPLPLRVFWTQSFFSVSALSTTSHLTSTLDYLSLQHPCDFVPIDLSTIHSFCLRCSSTWSFKGRPKAETSLCWQKFI